MTLAYARTGNGAPLVLIHGLGHRRQGWDAVVPRLAAERDVIAVDLPAMGESPHRRSATEQWPDMVEKLFGELGLERPAVAGTRSAGSSPRAGRPGRRVVGRRPFPGGILEHAERWWCITVFRIAGLLGARLPDGALERIVGNRVCRAALFGLFLRPPGRHPAADLTRDLRGSAASTARPSTRPGRARPVAAPRPAAGRRAGTVAWGRRDLLLFPTRPAGPGGPCPGSGSSTCPASGTSRWATTGRRRRPPARSQPGVAAAAIE